MKDENEKLERDGFVALCHFALSALKDVCDRDHRLALLREGEWQGIHEAEGALRSAMERLRKPAAPERPFLPQPDLAKLAESILMTPWRSR